MEILELVNQDHLPTEERPFACTVSSCNKTFGTTLYIKQFETAIIFISCFIIIGRRSDLVRHLRIHTNERYVTDTPKSPNWSIDLYILHRPFKCREPDCGKSFIQVRENRRLFQFWNQYSWFSLFLHYSDQPWPCICVPTQARDHIFANTHHATRVLVTAARSHVTGKWSIDRLMYMPNYAMRAYAHFFLSLAARILANDLTDAHLTDALRALCVKLCSPSIWNMIMLAMANDPVCSGVHLSKNVVLFNSNNNSYDNNDARALNVSMALCIRPQHGNNKLLWQDHHLHQHHPPSLLKAQAQAQWMIFHQHHLVCYQAHIIHHNPVSFFPASQALLTLRINQRTDVIVEFLYTLFETTNNNTTNFHYNMHHHQHPDTNTRPITAQHTILVIHHHHIQRLLIIQTHIHIIPLLDLLWSHQHPPLLLAFFLFSSHLVRSNKQQLLAVMSYGSC